jgi:hypothetical protein
MFSSDIKVLIGYTKFIFNHFRPSLGGGEEKTSGLPVSI